MDWEAFYNRFREPNFVPGYEIQNRLGGGAFGEVYKARKHSIGKAYAIKFLKIDDDAQRDAVEHELDAVRHFAAIDHPNLVTIEDLGTVLGVPYLIMGYAGEDTLARRLKQGQIESERALSYFVQACRGVVALHDRRLVHFDLKPSNVFLKGESARVGDYGLSKMMADGRTTLSFGRGTPQYMAPEMLRNRADHRADIYSLGVILYEVFARKLPFEGPVQGALAVRENDDPPVFPPEYPAGLRYIVERCLRLAPEDRYADVGELLAEMGQTARPGDSVRIDDYKSAPRTPPPIPPRRAPLHRAPLENTVADASRNDSTHSDARRTARELTRGAVEVARGMWDGIVTGAEKRSPSDRTPTPASFASPPPSVPPVPPPAGAGASSARAAPERDNEILALHTLASEERNLVMPDSAGGAGGVYSSGAYSGGGSMTIPVPPPVQGGFAATLFSAVALTFEVLFAVAGGLARYTGELFARLFRRRGQGTGVLRAFGRVLLAVFKVGLFVLALFVLGALTTLGAFFLFRGQG